MAEKQKSISFLMPGSGKYPCGGYKVIYEQANRLSDTGYDVYIVYPIHVFIRRMTVRNVLGTIRRYFKGFIGKQFKAHWFDLNNKIHEVKVFSLKYHRVPKTEYYCATALETSYFLETYAVPEKNKLYYIQGFEAWGEHTEEDVYISYKFPMKKIAIAPYLVEKVATVGSETFFIPNGFDFTAFGLDNPIEERNPHTAMMLYSSNNDIKRCSDMIAAFKKVKESIADLKVIVFGVPERPKDLPDFFEYHQTPSQKLLRTLYNTASVFVAASRTEGFALPPGEAFICGCALCCTDIGGFGVYAVEGKTALISPVYDIGKLAENITFLMAHSDVRIQFAKAGNELMKQFTWEKAFEKFVEVIEA